MKIIPINPDKPNSKIIRQAAHVLKQGGIVAFPTETAYGLAACATNPKAVQKVNELKGRPSNKHLPVIVADLVMAKKYVKFSATALKLAGQYWPGPLTMILPLRRRLPHQLTPDQSLGLRVPASKLARALSQVAGEPLISTSANLAGQPNPYSARRIIRDFRHQNIQPDLILDGGRLPKRKSSTIINLTTTLPRIERQGSIHINLDHVF